MGLQNIAKLKKNIQEVYWSKKPKYLKDQKVSRSVQEEVLF